MDINTKLREDNNPLMSVDKSITGQQANFGFIQPPEGKTKTKYNAN
ncbi:uncharacterized protein G2W53_003350 [Senna tora]|uniref:Uncharacterized protein n=1 Tax=Senna tora TaxID=362788 RepID=A0A835CJ71_9FABA|nr:uncharacterized protein G2W53_003350 [Senna tora]